MGASVPSPPPRNFRAATCDLPFGLDLRPWSGGGGLAPGQIASRRCLFFLVHSTGTWNQELTQFGASPVFENTSNILTVSAATASCA